MTPAASEHLGRTERRPSSVAGRIPDGDRDDALPDCYGHSRVVLLAVDPFHVHAYWEMTLPDRIRARELLSPLWENEAPTWVLRFYDVTSIDFDGSNARSTFDVAVSPSARNWYVELWSSDKSYVAELGPRFGEQFVPVCRSNRVRIPRSEPPPPREPEWQAMPAAVQESSASVAPSASASAEQPAGVADIHASPLVQSPLPMLPTFPRHAPTIPLGDTRAFEAALRGAADGPLLTARGVSLSARRAGASISGRGSGGRWLRTPAETRHGGSKA
ncbi:MAG: DUF4912 domain-containing protein [Polyangiaceae bacterium]|nr:DUF4912 domain-containing protein [Polyangiaceae bacterium]